MKGSKGGEEGLGTTCECTFSPPCVDPASAPAEDGGAGSECNASLHWFQSPSPLPFSLAVPCQ
ncbi:predicted protein [Plenodomus lingam JN3]|nr:predicted protein [Plenodomus lingam JN3]CBX90308.1 predicted protein [Plenodomus lingam JN3]